MKNSPPFFSQNPLNRLDHTRREEAKIQELFIKENTKFLLFFEGKLLGQDFKYLFSHETLLRCKYDTKEFILLGEFEDTPYFCIPLQELPNSFLQTDLRECAQEGSIKEELLGIFAQAASVLHWHNNHRFCGLCGAKTQMFFGGWRRECTSCKIQHFPRLDPVVIMLVTHEQYCLLAKGKRFKQNRYSCLAGFMESGESIEDATRRELFEEVGLKGDEVNYIASQPWPFPNNLMVGVHVKTKETKLHIDPFEIVDAKWFHKDEIKALLENKSDFDFDIPGRVAIARNLLEFWIKE